MRPRLYACWVSNMAFARSCNFMDFGFMSALFLVLPAPAVGREHGRFCLLLFRVYDTQVSPSCLLCFAPCAWLRRILRVDVVVDVCQHVSSRLLGLLVRFRVLVVHFDTQFAQCCTIQAYQVFVQNNHGCCSLYGLFSDSHTVI